MDNQFLPSQQGRRNFLGQIAASAAGLGLASLTLPLAANAESPAGFSDADEWFNRIKGTHRVVFDCPRPHDMMPFAWPKVFLMTNAATGSEAGDCGVVVVLRHEAIPYAFNSSLWEKYKMGAFFHANDPATGKASLRNPFWKPAPGAFKVPGIGEVQIGIDELQASGVMFCVCEMAMRVNSAVIASQQNLSHEAVMEEWKQGILPGIQPVPSGVWALGRAQEHHCAYIFAG